MQAEKVNKVNGFRPLIKRKSKYKEFTLYKDEKTGKLAFTTRIIDPEQMNKGINVSSPNNQALYFSNELELKAELKEELFACYEIYKSIDDSIEDMNSLKMKNVESKKQDNLDF